MSDKLASDRRNFVTLAGPGASSACAPLSAPDLVPISTPPAGTLARDSHPP